MALTACPECQEQISTLATTCPHCGAPQTSESVAKAVAAKAKDTKYRAVGCLGFVGLFILIWLISFMYSSSPKTPDRDTQRAAAIVACESRVRTSLKAPVTARFPGSSEVDVRDKGAGVAVVMSHVDAQNSFGAMIRTRWICEVDVSDANNPSVRSVALEEMK